MSSLLNLNFTKLIWTGIFLLFVPLVGSSQDTSASGQYDLLLILLVIVFVVAILVLVVAGYTLYILRLFMRLDAEQKTKEAGEVPTPSPSLWNKLVSKLNRSVPVEQEEEILLDHDYDGIKELDNHLPPWWKWLFYGTIIWSAIYLFIYHVIDVLPLQEEEYQIAMEKAEEEQATRMASMDMPEIDENSVTPTDDPEELASGEQIYNTQCAACHREDGGGGIGPNLTDNYWIHGGSMSDIYKTVKNGVPEKGMISWEPVLNPVQMRNVSSYILTLVGTDPPDPKAPQGEPDEPDTISTE